ncbi:MAG TPA: hypothetical protein VED17_06545 [Nitrososphaerales archaeon]|nr:hypothetical protein [Nitrososphaerales archaeon]
MLEPPTPAGEPFGPQEEENKTSADFENVCISLVERGWKIMPKKGTYPINKKGPRYVNLVDPRGNRKSIRVIDEALWEKLRAAEIRRTQKRGEEPEALKAAEFPASQNGELREVTENILVESEIKSATTEVAEPVTEAPIVEQQEVAVAVPVEIVTETASPPEQISVISEEKISVEMPTPTVREDTTSIPALPAESVIKAEIVENPPKEFQSFALSSPGLQKSIFDLGFETLLNVLQKETLSPAEIVSKIQEWSNESKNLLEFVHKSQERVDEPPALPDTSEKDELISELQSTLKETEDKLAEILKNSREI